MEHFVHENCDLELNALGIRSQWRLTSASVMWSELRSRWIIRADAFMTDCEVGILLVASMCLCVSAQKLNKNYTD